MQSEGDNGGGAAAKPQGTPYVVLRRLSPTSGAEGKEHYLVPNGSVVFAQVAEVMLPARSRRTGAIAPALKEAKIEPKPGLEFLVLDGEQATTLSLAEREIPIEERFEVVSGA